MRAVEQEQAQHSITGSSDHMDQRFATLTRFTKSLVLFLSTASHVPPWLLSAPLTSLGTRTGGATSHASCAYLARVCKPRYRVPVLA